MQHLYNVSTNTTIQPIKEKITYTRLDVKQVSGIVFCEFGDLGKFSRGKKEGEHKEWYQNGELRFSGNFLNINSF